MNTDIQTLKSQNRPTNFPAMLEKFKGEIERALPRHLNGDRMARIALTAFRLNPKLGQCEPASVFAGVIQSSQLGLELNTRGRAYLVPYGRECQFIPGWMGLVDLFNRTKQGTVWTQAVFEGDDFDYNYGDNPYIHHKPQGESDPSKLVYAYAVGRRDGSQYPNIEVWSADRIRRHRDRYNKVGRSHYSFENWEMYCRKVVLLQVLKYMPSSAELDLAVSLNDAGETGEQHLKVDDAIEGTWNPVPEKQEEVQEQPLQDEPEQEPSVEYAKQYEEKARQAASWPKKIVDEETGEFTWQDSKEVFFNPEIHAMGANGIPLKKLDGTFQKRRGRRGPARQSNTAPEPEQTSIEPDSTVGQQVSESAGDWETLE